MFKLTKFDPFKSEGERDLGPIWFAPDALGSVEADWNPRGGSVLYRKGDSTMVRVRESPEQVLEMREADEHRASQAGAYGAAFALWVERAADHRRLSYVEACADLEVTQRAHVEASAVGAAAGLGSVVVLMTGPVVTDGSGR